MPWVVWNRLSKSNPAAVQLAVKRALLMQGSFVFEKQPTAKRSLRVLPGSIVIFQT